MIDCATDKTGDMMRPDGIVSSWIVFLLTVVVSALGLLLYPPTVLAATGMWVAETVDDSGTVGWDSSVAVDSNGWVHISYYDATHGDLRHAVNAYGTWVIETVDGTQGDVGMYSSIAIDSSDKVHVGYYDLDSGYLMHATNAGGAWVTEVVDGAGGRGEYLSLAIDSFDKVHISYYDRTNGDLRYATNAGPPPPPGGSAWTMMMVDDAGATGDVGWYTSIGIDSAGKAHISYYDAVNMDLKYATNASGLWVPETVDSTGDTGWDTDIDIDGSDVAHISYYDATVPDKMDLRYARGSAGSWDRVTVDTTGDAGSHSSLDAAPSGIVHIAYYDYTNGALRYAVSNSANIADGWVIDTIDSGTGDVGSYASLTVDSTGDIHISYYDGISGDLKYTVSRSLTNLKKGFNFISAPTNALTIPAFTFMGFIDPAGDGVSRVLRYNRTTMKVEEAYRSNGVIAGDNFTVTAGDGLIVYALKNISIDLLQDICPQLNLLTGTNWVGTPCQPEHQTAFSVLQSVGSTNAISIQRFNPGTGRFETAGFRNGQAVGVNFRMERRQGYFINMNSPVPGFRP